MERLLKLRRRQLMYPRGGGILCSVSPASPKWFVLGFCEIGGVKTLLAVFVCLGLRVRSRLSIDALRGFRWVLFSSDEVLIGEDGGSLGVSSGGGGMEEKLCV
ncbi:hypothetical protein IGI04_033818 [Brassica rapa subsp. trilocularis]|uniref:Uncharacterized protein n=1 Tax=Brassica rapa subsp. trilocularis TaxID=1813537 RepID=A0ABQ7LA85_BRACM|nr:hypothetical protein IGI04_033818 [Brassica rapa subsp. trilocularis]